MLSVRVLQAQECETLMRVVRELTASRSKLVAGKSIMAERYQGCSSITLAGFNVSLPCMKAWES